jgi:GT2 family glycosyltransferase
MAAWDELLGEEEAGEGSAPALALRVPHAEGGGEVAVSVILPTRNGGPRLGLALQEIFRQQLDVPFEVLCVDSASDDENLARMRAFPVRLESIPPESFDHGLTRDLGARLARGRVLVFLNQDAVPVDRLWLHRMTAPLLRPGRYAAVQGGIREVRSATRSSIGTPADRASTSPASRRVGSRSTPASASRP